MMVIIMDTHYTRNVPMIQDQYLPSWSLFKLPMKVPIYALFLPASRDLCRWVFWPSVLDSCDPPSISWSISHVWRFFPQKSTCFLIPFWGKTRIDPPFFLKQCTVRGSIPCFLMSYVWPRSSKTRLLFPPTVWGLRWCNLFNSNDFPQLHQPPWKFPCMNGFPLTLISYIYISPTCTNQ